MPTSLTDDAAGGPGAPTASPAGSQLPETRTFVDAGGIKLHYELSRPFATGETVVVLIHGFGASLETWHDVYPGLSAALPVIRLDLAGTGWSDLADDYAPARQADFVRHALVQLGVGRAVLVGHSLGGAVALVATLNAREAGEPSIAGLVLIGSAAFPQRFPFFISALRSPVIAALVGLMSPRMRARYVLRRVTRVRAIIDGARIERYVRPLVREGRIEALAATARTLEADKAMIARMPTLTAPVLLIWGANDPVVPLTYGYKFLETLPNARLHVMADTGHLPQEERPSETVRLIVDFVTALR